MNIKKIVCITALASLAMTGTAFAGTWKGGEGENQNKWWYDNGNGSYPSNCWQWIDGNGDGTAESYYFDHNGWLLTDTTTPDGYTVNASGAWVQNGVVQTKKTRQAVNEPKINVNANPIDYEGIYSYSGAASYVYNEQTRQYVLCGITEGNSWDEWLEKIYPSKPTYEEFAIKKTDVDRYRFVDKVRTTYRFIRDDGEWYYDINSDGRIDEYERDRKNELERSYNYPEIEFLEDGRIMMNTERYLDYTGSDGSTSSRYGWPSQGKFLLKTEIYYTRR